MPSTQQPSYVVNYAPAESGHRAAVVASFLGWTLDAFDFFLVGMSLTAIAKECGFAEVIVYKDLAALDRVVAARL